ncbi:MAG: hypothetical protein R6X06_01375 [Gammaproteobacteria bacterium]
MRYREGEIPANLDPLIGHGPLMIAAVIGLLTGIGMLVGGIRTKIFWLKFWGVCNIVASLSYIIYYLLL